MLPELTDRVKGFLARREQASRPLSLDIKGAEPVNPNDANSYIRNGFYGLASVLDGWGAPAWSGEAVTLHSALNHSVVFTCKRIIAESVSTFPLPMMQKKNGEKQEATAHPMYGAFQNGDYDLSAQRLRETVTGHIVLGGDGYSHIHRRSGTGIAMELQMLLPNQVTPDRETRGQRRRVYVVNDGNSASRTYTVERDKPQDILHIPGIGWNGIRGYSVLTLARQSIGTALGAERHVGRFYARGGRLPYNLKLSQKFDTDEDFKKFRDDWNAVHSDPNEAPILEPWMEYESTGLNLVDSQMLESRQFSVPEICRWFRISPHLAGDLSNANNSITEQLALEFVTFTLHPWLKRWEQELWRCVLTPEEKHQGYYWRHNVNGLLRGAFETRMKGYSVALQNGFMSQNEVRDLEDWNGFEGGDDYHIQLNMQQLPTVPQDAAAQQPQGGLVRLGNGSKYRRVA